MINLAVVNIKDITKYILKLLLVCLILWGFSKIFTNKKLENTDIKIITGKIDIQECLDEVIPGIKQINNKNEENKLLKDINNIEPKRIILGSTMAMIYNTKNKEEEVKEVDGQEKNEPEEVEHAQTGLTTEIIENNVPNKYTNNYNSVYIKNGTDYNLTEEMLKPDIEVNNENIIIFHTHTCESYTPTEKYNYQQTGTYRTTDNNYNVVRVGTELTNQLLSYNYKVIHDTTYHDYPAYSGSYDRSLNTVKAIIANNKNTDVIFDIHRDAIGDYNYAPTVKIGEEYAAQLMFVIGTDGGGLEHPNWQQNLKFAVKVQEKANELYPGLFKPIVLRNSRYNQHVSKAASIIEVGATGNTMEQCLTSMKYLAKVISEVMK